MFGISWMRIGLGLVVGAIVLGVLGYALGPWFAQRANERAAGKVTTTLAVEKPKEAVAAAKVEGKSDAKVEGITTRSRARVARIIAGPDGDVEFYAGMCERELYRADPECGGRGGGQR